MAAACQQQRTAMAAPQHGFSRKDSIHGCPGRLTQLHYQCCTQHRSAQQHRTAHPAPHCGADTQDTTPGLPLQAQCNLPLPGLPQLLLLCPNIAFSSSSQPHPAPHLGTDKQDSTCGHLIRWSTSPPAASALSSIAVPMALTASLSSRLVASGSLTPMTLLTRAAM